jgi:hypothetical protein
MFYASDGTCGGYCQEMWTAPSRCPAPVVAAGLVLYEQPRPTVWWAFACPDHIEHLTAARPLLDRDRAEITRRRTPGERAGPLAVGREARELLDWARRWARAHPELTFTPPAAADVASRIAEAPQRTTAGNPFAAYADDAPDRPRPDAPLPNRGEQPHP